MTEPRPLAPRDAAEGAGPLSIELTCPKCGGPLVVDDEVACAACDHCGSLLVFQAPERDEVDVADGQIRRAEDIFEILVLYRVESQRAEIVGRYRDKDGNPPALAFVELLLREYEEHVRRVTRVLEAYSLQVPYWHVTGAIVQGILGRHHDGPKHVRLRAFAVEHTVPAYDVAKANLRDRGLRLARARVRELTVRDVRTLGAFLPWLPAADRPYREIDKWKGQDLDREIEPVAKHGLFLFGRRLLVYRPYWLARVMTDTGQEWILADGSFATLAGHPSEIEARSLLDQAIADPLRSEEPSFRRVHVVASRCPDCGCEQSFDGRERIVVCPSCHRGLEPRPKGIRLFSYAHERGEGTDYVPFWRFEFTVTLGGGGGPFARLEDYARALLGRNLPAAFQVSGPHLWIPAFRLLGTAIGDRAFKELAWWAHATPLDVSSEKIPVGLQPTLWGVSVAEEDARSLAPFVLMGLHDKASAARLNTLLLKKAVQDAATTLSRPVLVMVPFERVGRVLQRPGVALPVLLLRGGPELQAMRATVEGARAERQGGARP